MKIQDLTDDQIISWLQKRRHDRDMGYPVDERKIKEYADEAEKRGLFF